MTKKPKSVSEIHEEQAKRREDLAESAEKLIPHLHDPAQKKSLQDSANADRAEAETYRKSG